MTISLTESAADQVRTHLDKRGEGIGLRLGVKKTGCSGLAYVIDYADEITDRDVVFEDNGVTVVVEQDSLGFLDGTQLDYQREGLNETFKFHNPNVRDECGCGESFNV